VLTTIRGKTITRTAGFSQNDGDDSRCWNVRLQKPAEPGPTLELGSFGAVSSQSDSSRPNYILRISASPVEIAPKHIVSTITYNGQFPGPLLRFKEGQPATVEVHNDADIPEQLQWHGQTVSTEVDGAAEEGTPFIPVRGMRRIVFSPWPSGFRSITRIIGRAQISTRDSTAGKSAPCTSNPSMRPEVMTGKFFLVLKEFEPSFSPRR